MEDMVANHLTILNFKEMINHGILGRAKIINMVPKIMTVAYIAK